MKSLRSCGSRGDQIQPAPVTITSVSKQHIAGLARLEDRLSDHSRNRAAPQTRGTRRLEPAVEPDRPSVRFDPKGDDDEVSKKRRTLRGLPTTDRRTLGATSLEDVTRAPPKIDWRRLGHRRCPGADRHRERDHPRRHDSRHRSRDARDRPAGVRLGLRVLLAGRPKRRTRSSSRSNPGTVGEEFQRVTRTAQVPRRGRAQRPGLAAARPRVRRRISPNLPTASRAPVAMRDGIRSGVCLPILQEDKLIGTMDFFATAVVVSRRCSARNPSCSRQGGLGKIGQLFRQAGADRIMPHDRECADQHHVYRS